LKRQLVTAALLGVVGGLAAAVLFGRMSVDLGLVGVLVAWEIAPNGSTVLAFPPLGDVLAYTHSGPSRLLITLERINLESLRSFLDVSQESRLETIDAVTARAMQALGMYIARLLVTAALGGAALMWGLSLALRGRPSARRMMAAAAAGALAMGAVIGLARVTYNLDGFRSPVYSGAIEAVPWLVETVDDAIVKVEEIDQRLRALSSGLYRMYQRVESLPPSAALDAADVVVLHVTDFHNHPSAATVVSEIARSFGVDFIVNTGDLTDFGTVLETELLEGLWTIDVPHLFVSGNHETPAVLDKIESLGSITLIDGRQVEHAGLTVAGLPDPAAFRQSAEAMSPTEAMSHAQAINQRLGAMEDVPDILALHNFRTAQGVNPGLVPAILFGHSHTASVQFRSGTAYVNAGTTGGAGLRGLEANLSVPITLAVVYFERLQKGDEGHGSGAPEHFRSRVIAVDILRLSPYAGGFTLERHLAPR